MVFKSPPQTKKAGPNPQWTKSESDLSSKVTTSIVTNKNVQHSPKQTINAQKFALPSNLIQSELQITFNELSASNNIQNKSASSTNTDENKNNENASTADVNKVNSDVGQCLVQTGLDRYITVSSKRRRSPRSAVSATANKFTKLASVELTHGNRFSCLIAEDPLQEKTEKSEKPPPIYLREESNRELAKTIEFITEGKFYISGIKRGDIKETKIQPLNIDAYRALIKHFDQVGKHYYTYQLKSQKGLVIMLKGIESYVDVNEIHAALAEKGFQCKSITNIFNREKKPQPLFRLELESDDKNVKGKRHAIFDLKYLLHRRVTIEEPRKRNGPVQCIKCQEYGHTKAYCTLSDVCVICGELHSSQACNKVKTETSVRKCSNCDGNHTANYRGCPIYLELKRRINPRQRAEQRMLNLRSSARTEVRPEVVFTNAQNRNQNTPLNSSVHQGSSYASILKGTAPKVEASEEGNISAALNKLTSMMQSFMSMMERTIDLMMQNMSTLMQIVVKNQK
jgi:hypothetical protein